MAAETYTDPTPCSYEGCEATVKSHRWGKIKASDWFFTREGQAWCPDHHPEWVAAWRAKKATARPDSKSVVLHATCTSCGESITKTVSVPGIWLHESGGTTCG